MKERKYQESYSFRTQLDPKTGKERRIPVYEGKYYSFSDSGKPKTSVLLPCGLVAVLFLAIWLIYLFSSVPSTYCIYVLPMVALCIFPLAYLLMGLASALHSPERMTIVQKEKGMGRIYRSLIGCFAFSALALGGDVVFLLKEKNFSLEWHGLLLFCAMALVAFAGMRLAKRLYHSMKES